MNRSFDSFHSTWLSRILIIIGLVAAAAVGGCGEKLEAGSACPLLCPRPDIEPRDTLVEGVVVDSTIAGFPPIGQESDLLLAARGDTLDTRVIFRFDSLPKIYTHPSATSDTIVNHVDSATLRIVLDTTTLAGIPGLPTTPVTMELYDVDSPADTVAADLLPLFSPDRLLGSKTFAPESLARDTLFLPIAPAAVLSKIVTGSRLRLGLRLVSSASSQLRIFSSSAPAELRFKPASDTAVTVSLLSKTPSDTALSNFRTGLEDYVIVAKAPPPPPANTIIVGGYPARRTYLRFELPSHIVDSSNVVRASLTLTQYPMPVSPGARDSLAIYPFALTAGTVITDVARLMQLASINLALATDSVRVLPADSGQKRFELVNLVKIWRTTSPTLTQRALILVIGEEGVNPAEAVFYSSEASPDLRPRLELTYVPKITLGLP
jgi:hypothetical protein